MARFLAGEPIEARPNGPIERTVKWARRRPALAALYLVGCLGIVGITWQWRVAVNNKDLAVHQKKEAVKQKKEAEEQKQRADKRMWLENAQRLAANSIAERETNPPLSLLLATQAVAVTDRVDEPIQPTAYEALINSVAAIGGTPLARANDRILSFTLAKQAQCLITSSDIGGVRLWELDADFAGESPPSRLWKIGV